MSQSVTNAQSMAFTNNHLGSAASAENKNGNLNSLSPFGHPSNAWGSSKIWGGGNGSASNGFTSNVATRDNSRSRETGLRAPVNRKEEIEGKTGSGSLVDSSVLDEWSIRATYSAPRSAASTRSTSQVRYQGSANAQQRSMSNAGQSFGGNNQSANSYTSRPPTISLNTTAATQQQRPSFSSPFASTFASRNSEPSSNGFAKFDRSTEVHKKPDSAIGSWADAVSPTDERRIQFPSQYGKSSIPPSRDQSLQPSQRSDERPNFTRPDYSHSAQNVTPLSSRAPSISSQRNGSYNGFTQNTDYIASQMGQLSLVADSRSSMSRKSIGSNSHSSQWSGLNGSHSLSRPSTNGTSGSLPAGDSESYEHHNGGYLGANGSPSQLQASIHPEYVTQGYPGRYMQPSGIDYRGSQLPPTGNFNSRSFEPSNGPRSMSNWAAYAGEEEFASNRPDALVDQQIYLESRVQQALAAQLRNPYSPMYNPYILQNSLQLGAPQNYLPMMSMPLNGSDTAAGARDAPPGDGVQSTLMYEFRANVKTKRYELKDIYNHIAEFSGDQHGSRFIQTKLETANSDEKERVFREIQPNAIPLMTDVFGNYVIQKFFEHGDQTHKKILANKMRGQVLNLSLQMYGCRVVQKALDHVLVDQQASLVSELENHVLKCVKDQNGNHVIQKAIERCPPSTIGFIIDAFRGQVQHLSIHAYGCRVIQRCLEHCEPSAKALIMGELMDGLQGMVADQYGNYVVQHIVSKHEGEAKQRVLQIVGNGLESYSKHKFASNVVEKCLESASDAWRRDVMYSLANNGGQKREFGEGVLVGLLKDNFGNYVIQKLLDTLCQDDYGTFIDILQPAVTQAKRTGCGKQIQSIEKKMHKFTTFRNGGIPMTINYNQQHQSPLTSPFSQHFETGDNGKMASTMSPPSFAQELGHSVDGDTTEGATSNSRKNSEQSIDVNEGLR